MPDPTTLLMSLDCRNRVDRDCEKLALARGVRFHVEGRIVLHESRAIVFGD